jgi:hypothetical protein
VPAGAALLVKVLVLLQLLLRSGESVVRTGEVSPRMPVSHDTFLYLCSLDVNEQNVAIEAFDQWRAHPSYEGKWGAGRTIVGELGPLGHGKDQAIPAAVVSSKGCSYRSDFNVGYISGVTDYRQGVELTYVVETTNEELITLRVFRTLPEWNETTNLGLTTYWLSEMIWINAPEPQRDQAPRLVRWWGKNLLDKPCTAWDNPGCAYEDIGWMVQSDLDCSGCKPADVWVTWQDYLPAYFPG